MRRISWYLLLQAQVHLFVVCSSLFGLVWVVVDSYYSVSCSLKRITRSLRATNRYVWVLALLERLLCFS